MAKHKKSKASVKNKSLKKQGAIEMSMTTIVIIVISVIVLIFGIIFARSVMCSGIQLTQQVNDAVKNQLTTLFGADNYGVVCMGERGQDIKLATGGPRQVVCMIKTEGDVDYNLRVTGVESLSGASESSVNRWIVDQDWKGTVSAGEDNYATILMLDIPRDAPATKLKLTIQETNDNTAMNSKGKTHIAYINVVASGFFRTTMCSV